MITDKQYQDLQFLANSAGWQAVSDYIKKQIEQCQRDLESRNFNHLAEAAILQGKLRALRTILDYPRTRIENYQKQEDK